jgi:hypothetical protein
MLNSEADDTRLDNTCPKRINTNRRSSVNYRNTKLERANQLFAEIKERETELNVLFGDIQQEQQQTRRGRPRKEQSDGSSSDRPVEAPLPFGADQEANGAA